MSLCQRTLIGMLLPGFVFGCTEGTIPASNPIAQPTPVTNAELPLSEPEGPFPAATNAGGLGDWQVAPSPAIFHQSLLDSAAYTGIRENRHAIDPFIANALESGGAAWGMVPRKAVLLLPGERAFAATHKIHGDQKVQYLRPWTLEDSQEWDRSTTGTHWRVSVAQGSLYLTGALRNGVTCQSCHEEAPDTLLGVYQFTFEEIADD